MHIKRPLRHEAIIPERLPKTRGPTVGTTEALPLSQETVHGGHSRGLHHWHDDVQVMNPTLKPVQWSVGHAFAYMAPIPNADVGVNLNNVDDCLINREHDKDQFNRRTKRDNGHDDDENCGLKGHDIPGN